jgi:hypothetical protein
MRLHGSLTAAACAIFSIVVCTSALGRDVKLTIYPQKASAEPGKYSLLPAPASLTDGDAVPLYDKAIKMLPDKKSNDQVQQYLKVEIDKLPADQVEQTLKPYIESFKYAVQAGKCRECKWQAWKRETLTVKVEDCHKLANAIQLWARDEIAQGGHEGAILALQTAFGMARHFVQAPDMVVCLRGASTANMMCREIEQYVQTEEAPNLYAALAALPRPFFANVEKVIEAEIKAFPSKPPAGVTPTQFESQRKLSKVSQDQWRAMAKRLDSDLAALQCVEAIRSFAASHGRQLPQALSDITEVSVPKDPTTGASFRYTRTGATAVLETTAPAAGNEKDVLRYEIVVKN